MVIFVHREEYYVKSNPDLEDKAEIIIGRHRNGMIKLTGGTPEPLYLYSFKSIFS